jgi:hypothetical protein
MKQIFCITAYKEFDYLEYFAEKISDIDCLVYIHIDKKCVTDDITERLNVFPYVTAISSFSVPWGIRHIQAILQLLEYAYEDNKNEKFYCHVLTGQDCLCRTKQE